jgi:glutamate synthase domain-containing protein 3
MKTVTIDAARLDHSALNRELRALAAEEVERVSVSNVLGQRYIAAGLPAKIAIDLTGVPGNDLGVFMDGPSITVHNNVQDMTGNTMGGGRIVVHGASGDLLGYAMRGGEIIVRDDVGYRVGVHMKAYQELCPTLVVGGVGHDYLGEYLAGGIIIVLNRNDEKLTAHHIGTGMHGGVILMRGTVEPWQLGREVGVSAPTDADRALLARTITAFGKTFSLPVQHLRPGDFVRYAPVSSRPYGSLYAY